MISINFLVALFTLTIILGTIMKMLAFTKGIMEPMAGVSRIKMSIYKVTHYPFFCCHCRCVIKLGIIKIIFLLTRKLVFLIVASLPGNSICPKDGKQRQTYLIKCQDESNILQIYSPLFYET
jgi:hypothetical protein